MADENQEAAEDGAAKKKGKGKLFFIALTVLLMAGAFVGGMFTARETWGVRTVIVEVEKPPEVKVAHYAEFDPSFTVNIPGDAGQHYVDINLAVLSYDKSTADAIRTYRPLLRNKILSVIANRRFEDLLPREGRERLLDEIRAGLDDVFLREDRQVEIEALYFTKFLMQ